MQPIGSASASAAHEDQSKGQNPPTADLSDIDSGWVILDNSDTVSADLAAAAVRAGQRLGASTIPSWARWVLGGVVYTVVPFYNRVRHREDETVGFVENAVEVVEHIAQVTEKLAANAAKQLPEDGSLQTAVEEVEHIAEVVDDDAEKFEALAEKFLWRAYSALEQCKGLAVKEIDKVSDEIDAAVEPVIEEVEKELDQSTTSHGGVNTKN